ncbi:jg1302 [Pararge aegeria aegeria]|uniref:Jg1302 protein n=1 Tax=Pararge aegeria aegeria TaxID=348720 RepID=A0A8S4RDW7_9NEOP|nr:jg1302 [Pararge aegeria aegeria]
MQISLIYDRFCFSPQQDPIGHNTVKVCEINKPSCFNIDHRKHQWHSANVPRHRTYCGGGMTEGKDLEASPQRYGLSVVERVKVVPLLSNHQNDLQQKPRQFSNSKLRSHQDHDLQ